MKLKTFFCRHMGLPNNAAATLFLYMENEEYGWRLFIYSNKEFPWLGAYRTAQSQRDLIRPQQEKEVSDAATWSKVNDILEALHGSYYVPDKQVAQLVTLLTGKVLPAHLQLQLELQQ